MDKIFNFFNKAFNSVKLDDVFNDNFKSTLYILATIFAIIVFAIIVCNNKYAKGARGLGVVVAITSAISVVLSAAYCIFFAQLLNTAGIVFNLTSFKDIVPFVLQIWATFYGKIVLGISAFMFINWVLVFIYFLINSKYANKGAGFFFIFFLIIASLVAMPIPLYLSYIPGIVLNTLWYAIYYIGYLVIWLLVYIFLGASKKSLRKVFYKEETVYYLPEAEKLFKD